MNRMSMAEVGCRSRDSKANPTMILMALQGSESAPHVIGSVVTSEAAVQETLACIVRDNVLDPARGPSATLPARSEHGPVLEETVTLSHDKSNKVNS